jgi:AcrR family transcriptional regulator
VSVDRFDPGEPRPRGGRMPRRERRAQLLESALEVFVAQGYHAAAMDDIAERAGVSKPVLYQHFPGKLELYLALLDTSCDTIIDNCRQALAATNDNKRRVEATMDVFYTYVAADTGAFRLVFESDLTSEPAVREHVDRVTTECAAMIAEVIHRPARRRLPAARGLARGNGPGERPVLAVGDRRHQPGRRGGPGRRARLARDPRLPARALSDTGRGPSGPAGYRHHTPPSYT